MLFTLYNLPTPILLPGSLVTLPIIDVYEAMKHIDYVFHCAGFVSFNTADYQTLYDKCNRNKTYRRCLGTWCYKTMSCKFHSCYWQIKTSSIDEVQFEVQNIRHII